MIFGTTTMNGNFFSNHNADFMRKTRQLSAVNSAQRCNFNIQQLYFRKKNFYKWTCRETITKNSN